MYLVRVVLMADVQRVETLDDFLEFSENYIFGSLRAIEVRARVIASACLCHSSSCGFAASDCARAVVPRRVTCHLALGFVVCVFTAHS